MDNLTVFYNPNKTFDDNFDNGPYPTQQAPPLETQKSASYTFLGHKLNSPFGIPAGPLPTSRHIELAFKLGFDVACYKTQRTVVFPANKFPNIVYLDVGGDLTLEKASQPILGSKMINKPVDQITITNSFGNPSRGPEYWVNDLKLSVAVQKPGQLVIASVVGTIQPNFSQEDYYDDFARAAELAASTGVSVIEVNLSCPNVANESIVCYTPEAVKAICEKTKQRIGNIPLVIKLGYFSKDQQSLLERVLNSSKPYVAAIAAINTIPVPVVDEHGNQLLPGENRLISGACGNSIKWAGLDMVRRLDEIRQAKKFQYEIIGVGGVMNSTDYSEYISAGANVVQSATGAMWNPRLAQEIKAKLN